MRSFERRATAAYPYFKLSAWDDRLCAWRVGKSAAPTEAAARALATAPGRYRISRVDEHGKAELEPFEVGA